MSIGTKTGPTTGRTSVVGSLYAIFNDGHIGSTTLDIPIQSYDNVGSYVNYTGSSLIAVFGARGASRGDIAISYAQRIKMHRS